MHSFQQLFLALAVLLLVARCSTGFFLPSTDVDVQDLPEYWQLTEAFNQGLVLSGSTVRTCTTKPAEFRLHAVLTHPSGYSNYVTVSTKVVKSVQECGWPNCNYGEQSSFDGRCQCGNSNSGNMYFGWKDTPSNENITVALDANEYGYCAYNITINYEGEELTPTYAQHNNVYLRAWQRTKSNTNANSMQYFRMNYCQQAHVPYSRGEPVLNLVVEGPVRVYVKQGAPPTVNDYDYEGFYGLSLPLPNATLTDYYVGVTNRNDMQQDSTPFVVYGFEDVKM